MCERLFEFTGPPLPDLLHGLLTVLAQLQLSGPLIERRNETSHNVTHFGFRKHAGTGLHEQILIEEKHFGADPRFVRGRIVGPGQLAQPIGQRTLHRGAQQEGDSAPQTEIFRI